MQRPHRKPPAFAHPANVNIFVQNWVRECIELCAPDKVVWCDGSKSEREALCEQGVKDGRPGDGGPAQLGEVAQLCRMAEDEAAIEGRELAGDRPQQRGLAGSVGPAERDDLTRSTGEVERTGDRATPEAHDHAAQRPHLGAGDVVVVRRNFLRRRRPSPRVVDTNSAGFDLDDRRRAGLQGFEPVLGDHDAASAVDDARDRVEHQRRAVGVQL